MSVKDPKEIRQKCIGIFLVSSLKSTWLVRREVTKIKPSFHVGSTNLPADSRKY